MRFLILGLSLVLATGASALAQNGPPGFAPGQTLEPSPNDPSTPRVFDGMSNAPNPYFDVFSNNNPPAPIDLNPNAAPPGRSIFRSPWGLGTVIDQPPRPLFWFSSEALLWWTKGSPLPVPLVTLGDRHDAIPGAIGQPGTSVLLGNQTVDLMARGGGRFTLGAAIDPDRIWGIEGSYFYLPSITIGQGFSSSGDRGSALLAFPFYDPTLPGENASPIAYPGSFAGQATVSITNMLQGAELNLLYNQINSENLRLDFLGGFRYVNMREDLNFTTDSPNVYPNPAAFFHTYDQFNANNNFYGAQLGVRATYDLRFVYFNAATKLALGDMVENVAISGGTSTNIGGGFSSAPGGYLSQPTNIGSQTRDQFAVVPEFDLNLGIRLRPWASLVVGYSFLYLSSVARPGNQIDRTINPNNSPAIGANFSGSISNPTQPVLNIHNSDFWAQGLNFTFVFQF